jgi:hypothetical membrane protein
VHEGGNATVHTHRRVGVEAQAAQHGEGPLFEGVVLARHVAVVLGAAGPVIFIASYLVNGATQPGHSSWHDTISTLSLARRGWIQVAGFTVYGALALCFAEGLRRSGAIRGWGWRLLVIAGLGLLVIGPFRTDPILGFPAGEPAVTIGGGTVHTLTSLVVFVAVPAAMLATRRHSSRDWAAFSVAGSVLSLLAVVVYAALVAAAHGHDGGDSPAGLFERLPTLFIGLWQVAFAVRVWTGRHLAASRQLPGRGTADSGLRSAGLDSALRAEEGR